MRFIVVVIDSYGCGAMDDILPERPYDRGAHTYYHIFEQSPHLRLPVLQKLGLGNAADPAERFLKHAPKALWGTCLLQHWGADTFLGHQEILGTVPKHPKIEPFSQSSPRIEALLRAHGLNVRRFGTMQSLLVVEEALTIGDNMETDAGQNVNLTVSFDAMPYQKAAPIARLVRAELSCNRVIVFGAPGVSLKNILAAYKEDGVYAGVSAPASGVYKEGYQVLHLGYGIDKNEQVPHLLAEEGIPSFLIGKVADVCENHPLGKSFGEIADTNAIMDIALRQLEEHPHGFFCINIQETDLAGHAEDALRYGDVLETADRRLGELLPILTESDLLIVCADHGNDPSIGHSRHTRERVPLLAYSPLLQRVHRSGLALGERATLSDIAASACDFFKIKKRPPNGSSFLRLLNRINKE